jgi:class I fructose-bisphosphate aldolase
VTSAPAHDVAVIGAGAAGLATAIYLRELAPDARVTVFDGARSPGAKILVSGGSRCNVTNTVVTEGDFNTGSPAIVRRVLRAWPVDRTVEFFHRIGVPLHEEPGGKLFPDSHRSRDVLEALLRALQVGGADLRAGTRVLEVARTDDGFRLATPAGAEEARHVVLATGGLSLPKTGSDGAGYTFARQLGHTIVPTTPALAPLVLDDDGHAAMHRELSGVAQPVRLTLAVSNGGRQERQASGSPVSRRPRHVEGALLWTHFGISGPAALDISRHWLRARIEGRTPTLTASLTREETFRALDRGWTALGKTHPRARVRSVLAARVPASAASALMARAEVRPDETMAELTRDCRRRLVHLVTALPIAVRDSRGYDFAEVTAGGISLTEVDWRSMGSRVCEGLYAVGEILDVDGRIGGFNFQWAWSSARVAAEALAARLGAASAPAPVIDLPGLPLARSHHGGWSGGPMTRKGPAPMAQIAQLLGEKADYLLGFSNPKIAKDRLHLPGPDFVDRIFAQTDRNIRVLVNLQRLFGTGRLANTGYVSILPVDQGVEHSGGASFARNPDYFDPENIVQLAIEGGCNAVASTFGVLGMCARKYAHKIPFLVKFNHSELLTYPNRASQIMYGTIKEAADMGCAAVGATIYFGSEDSGKQIVEVAEAFHAAHEHGMATVLWCYLRNDAFKVKGADGRSKDYHVAADLTGQANHLGVTIEADIIKQKLPEQNGGFEALNMGGSSYGKFDKRIYTELASDHPIDLCRYQVANCYMGRAGLINSGGASMGDSDVQEAIATAVVNKRAGGMGLISGRKAFQRPRADGAKLLNAIQDVYADTSITVA